MRKLIILFIKVAPNCHGKRNNRGAKERDSRREKWREVMISRWPLYCIFLSHGAPRQLVPAPTPSFMPWGHCYFFCRQVISFAWQLWATVLYQLFTRIPCSPALERKIKTTVWPQQVEVPKFWGWRLTNNLFFTHIYFLFFDCQVKLIFHVIKCHSYKFVHVWLMPSIPPPPVDCGPKSLDKLLWLTRKRDYWSKKSGPPALRSTVQICHFDEDL